MEIEELKLPSERLEKLKEAVNKRFGTGYFGLNAGIYAEVIKNDKYDFRLTFCNFNSVSGWATIGGIKWNEKQNRFTINFRGPGLGKTGKSY